MTLREQLSLTVARLCPEDPSQQVRIDRVFRNRRTGFRLRVVEASANLLTYRADNAANGWGGKVATMSRAGVSDVFDPKRDAWEALPPMGCGEWKRTTCVGSHLPQHEPIARPEARIVFIGMVDAEFFPLSIAPRRFAGKEA